MFDKKKKILDKNRIVSPNDIYCRLIRFVFDLKKLFLIIKYGDPLKDVLRCLVTRDPKNNKKNHSPLITL